MPFQKFRSAAYDDRDCRRRCDENRSECQNASYCTVNGAVTVLLCPPDEHVTVYVPVPFVVFETVRYVQVMFPLLSAVCVSSPWAVLFRPDGSFAEAVQVAAGAV